ncbi:MAG: PIG-L family deacetylase [Steroidobacteraceae bacterium]
MYRRTVVALLAAALCAAALVRAAAAAVAATTAASAAGLPLMTPITASDRILVVAPHPDDESLCCAGLIQQALAAGAQVGVVWITAGDGFELDALLVEHTLSPDSAAMQRLGRQRLREARTAAATLGVPPNWQFVLGYPDRGIEALMGSYYNRPYRSRYTANTHVRYAGAVSPDASYTGANLQQDLAKVFDEFRPTLVFAAAPQDLHPDHRASGELVRRILGQRNELGALRYWIVHAHRWPRPYGLNPALSLQPPPAAAALAWHSLPLSASDRSGKLTAISAHESQLRVMGPLMKAFVRANELFAPALASVPR